MMDDSGDDPIRQIAISKFKATCLAVLEEVRTTGRPVLVTRFGTPVAKVVPAEPTAKPADWMGKLRHRTRIKGDIVGPIDDLDNWDAWRK